ncbi:hypothetical protein N0V90_002336 [Kalmusia sp. IMI 367209]|nr:hypothetical protein N0V90_002336 [Kalmusia sp. IMI 367209]
MRSFSFTLLLFGLLGLLAVSVPAGWEAPAAKSLGEYEHGLNDVEVAVDGLNLDLGSKEVDTFESGLVKLQNRGRGRSRPKKTRTRRPKKNKKNKTKKNRKTKTKKNKKKKPKKAKKSKCNRKAKKGKHNKRAPANACPAPTADYTGALRAAKRKDPRAELVVGRTYMFIFKKATIAHASLIVGTVIEKSNGQLDFPAYSHGMVKETQRPGEPEISEMKDLCRSLRGATCELSDFERWNCGRGASERYSFKGEAIPQFAEPSYVKAIGWKFAKDAANVGKM